MKLYGALIVLVTLTTACGLRCYTCTVTDPRSCTDTKSCLVIFNRCFTLRVEGYSMVTKGCQSSLACVGGIECCEGNLCNSARTSWSQCPPVASVLSHYHSVSLSHRVIFYDALCF